MPPFEQIQATDLLLDNQNEGGSCEFLRNEFHNTSLEEYRAAIEKCQEPGSVPLNKLTIE